MSATIADAAMVATSLPAAGCQAGELLPGRAVCARPTSGRGLETVLRQFNVASAGMLGSLVHLGDVLQGPEHRALGITTDHSSRSHVDGTAAIWPRGKAEGGSMPMKRCRTTVIMKA